MNQFSKKTKMIGATSILLTGGIIILFVARQLEAADPKAGSELLKLSHSEKVQVEKNLNYFQSLSPEDQTELREMHKKIQGTNDLRNMFNIYCDWLDSLTPWQRKELAETNSVHERMALINRFLEENRAQENQKKMFDQLREEELSNQQETEARLAQLPAEIASILEPLRQKMKLEPEVQQSLDLLDQQDQNARLLRIALEQEFKKSGREQDEESKLVTSDMVKEMIRRIPNKETRKWLEKIPPQGHGMAVFHFIHHQIESYYRDFAKKGQEPTIEQLEDVFDKLDEKVKADIGPANQPPERFKRLLKKYWLNQDLGEIERLLNSQRKRDSRGRPGGRSRHRRPDDDRSRFGSPPRPNPSSDERPKD
ncbi:hypothetical protein Pla110_38730 [Polystyrenella longa]|uniref:Uncharacterized protein n=1 Tax=Polystyrenella longa TaxID=2528007 RepID=A0A518CSC2_9PLAN|nr:hypothetical protein [Polystyrenella longa]QDU82118.1 hypothetical protein Pla110_38730 [Polystyrenella longa]